MKKVDHLVARAFKGAMAFVLAVGLCPVAPAMAQEGATANEEEGTAAAAADGVDASIDGAGADAAGDTAGSEADGVQPGGVSGDADAAADGAGVGAPAQDSVENDGTGSGVSVDAAEAAAVADGEADTGVVIAVRVHGPVLQARVESITGGAVETNDGTAVVRAIVPGRLLIGRSEHASNGRCRALTSTA